MAHQPKTTGVSGREAEYCYNDELADCLKELRKAGGRGLGNIAHIAEVGTSSLSCGRLLHSAKLTASPPISRD